MLRGEDRQLWHREFHDDGADGQLGLEEEHEERDARHQQRSRFLSEWANGANRRLMTVQAAN